ncbi:MAG: hypothetical protein Q9227_003375 [Pyrenula ochraceoflavens]
MPSPTVLKLRNGANALKDFEDQEWHGRQPRSAKRPREPGFVDWRALEISDAEESTDNDSRRRSRRLASASKASSLSDTPLSAANSSSENESSISNASEDSEPAGRRSRRLVTLRKSRSLKEARNLLDVSDVDADADDDGVVKQRTRRASKRGRPSLKPSRPLKHDVYGTRRSERARAIPRRSMRERQEDEISEHEEEQTGPKIVATKEYFPRIPESDPFRRRHCQDCDTCHQRGDSYEKGPLVFCQGCTNTYHKSCLGPRGSRDHLVTKIAEQLFVLQCRRCLGTAHTKDRLAPHHGRCSTCKEWNLASNPFRARLTTRQEQLQREEHGGRDPITAVNPELLNSAKNIMFRCTSCQRAWHMHHLPKRPGGHLEDEEDEEEDELSLAQRRFDVYHRAWTCNECYTEKTEIDALVAWRPVDPENYIGGLPGDEMQESEKDYLIKWHRQSHFHTKWMPGAWVFGVAASAMRTAFLKKEENKLPKMTTEDAIPEAFLRIDIVFDVRYSSIVSTRSLDIDKARIREVTDVYVKFKGLGYEDTIWEKPPTPDDKDRWADFKVAYEDWCMLHYIHLPQRTRLQRHLATVRDKDFETELMKEKQPLGMTGGEMMDYQIEGLNWLYYQWFKGQNAILADEMGLGKTIQIIAYFATMVEDHKCWPFLVVVPNSTCPNWRREIKKWAPSIKVVTYYGSAAARKLVHDKELFPSDKTDLRTHIVVTSYEAMVEDKTRQSLQKVPWQGLVVDEGQRLKSEKTQLYECLSKMRFPFKVLLTGTPLQNNPRELFNLLQFLDPKINAAKMEMEYGELNKENVAKLHEMIRPFFLRRTKAQVLTFLPPLSQVIVPVTMSTVQKKVYKSILAKNPALMKAIFTRDVNVKNAERHTLNNILMQLRKVLCHPFVYSQNIEERTFDSELSHRNLVEASSKLQLLELMLPKLQERGHRVLIFSQFLDNLDVVEDFLDGLGLQHHRLDGSINSLEKQKRIDEFNAPDSPFFAFLLSTRAGGVGINLATADTVIIMDPDFNPHQDIQALSRAHRIGQKKKVLVFQIMTRASAEEKIMQIGKRKLAMDHVLIQQLDAEDDAGLDLESILRHGADALFDENNTDDLKYDAASIEALLDRSRIENTETGTDNSAESQFSFARVWANDKAALQDTLGQSEDTAPSTTIWDKILSEREKAAAEEAAARAQAFGRGKRKRETVDYRTADGPGRSKVTKSLRGSDGDYSSDEAESNDESEADIELNDFDPRTELEHGLSDNQTAKRPTVKARPFKRAKVPEGQAPQFGGDGPIDYAPGGLLPPPHQCRACGEFHALGWCRLKIAGVEHCGLCGLAHIGSGRTCPHLNSEAQVATMLGTLKESTESRELIDAATKYLRMIRGDLVQRKRNQERKGQETQENGMPDPNVPAIGFSRLAPTAVTSYQ